MSMIYEIDQIVREARTKILQEHGDSGTCVGGMKLRYNGIVIAEQIAQGSMTNEYWYAEIKRRMIKELEASANNFEIEDGWMD